MLEYEEYKCIHVSIYIVDVLNDHMRAYCSMQRPQYDLYSAQSVAVFEFQKSISILLLKFFFISQRSRFFFLPHTYSEFQF